MAKEYEEWYFKLPSLPKATYVKLTEFRVKHGLTQFQTVVIAIDLLAEAETSQPEMLEGVVKAFLNSK